jgi:hypothetical protein
MTPLALVLVALAGCAGTSWPRGEWTKPGVAASAQRHDEYECEREVALRRATGAEASALFAACMRARGYAHVGP